MEFANFKPTEITDYTNACSRIKELENISGTKISGNKSHVKISESTVHRFNYLRPHEIFQKLLKLCGTLLSSDKAMFLSLSCVQLSGL